MTQVIFPTIVYRQIISLITISRFQWVRSLYTVFFTSVASKLVSKLPTCSGLYGSNQVKKYYVELGVKPNSFSFAKVETAKIVSMLAELKCSKATGLDNIPASFLIDSETS